MQLRFGHGETCTTRRRRRSDQKLDIDRAHNRGISSKETGKRMTRSIAHRRERAMRSIFRGSKPRKLVTDLLQFQGVVAYKKEALPKNRGSSGFSNEELRLLFINPHDSVSPSKLFIRVAPSTYSSAIESPSEVPNSAQNALPGGTLQASQLEHLKSYDNGTRGENDRRTETIFSVLENRAKIDSFIPLLQDLISVFLSLEDDMEKLVNYKKL
ncbi:hypothetical protein GOBAR_AA09431 [Gossypium barbadense]|uniref:Uncharacterized protein n=1 Tax=Gossypium barbadense TaxID=3634 RepID=A0A2P5Y6N0_GOSBA|nr:hypothetical protein GOBAR_AA09431 [Gossypium barbadense]